MGIPDLGEIVTIISRRNRFDKDREQRRRKTWKWQETCSPGEETHSDLHQCISGDQGDD